MSTPMLHSSTLLTLQSKQPRTPTAVLAGPLSLRACEQLRLRAEGLYAVDLETRGTDPTLPDSAIVGIGIANNEGCWYLDLRGAESAALDWLRGFLGAVQLTAFNVNFDGAWLYHFCGKRWLNWVGCSYGLYKYLANEGYPEQSWGLESLQLNVLGWPASNKPVLEAKLTAAGLTKAEMWRLPAEDLGQYCASDADAAWQGWQVLTEAAPPVLLKFHQREFLTLVELLVEQQARGMLVDREQLKAHTSDLEQRTQDAMESFLNHPRVVPHVAAYNKEVRDAWIASEPPTLTQKGEPNKQWLNWIEREDVGYFNPNSKPQLGWLLYEKVFRVVRETPKMVFVDVDGKVFEFEKTPKGQRAVTKKLLPLFGEVGAQLMAYNKLVKEASYVAAATALAEVRTEIRPEFNSCGTVTGRPAGGEADDE